MPLPLVSQLAVWAVANEAAAPIRKSALLSLVFIKDYPLRYHGRAKEDDVDDEFNLLENLRH
jgi:hypothetical protein